MEMKYSVSVVCLVSWFLNVQRDRLAIEEAEIIRQFLFVSVSRHAVCANCTISIFELVHKKHFAQ